MATYVADVTLFDGRAVRDSRGVLVEDGRIAWVGAHARAPREARAAEEVDGRGRTLTPGLVDAHVHLAWDGTADMAAEAEGLTDAVALEKAARNLAKHAAAGVTLVRDLGAPSPAICEIATAVDRGELTAPRILPAGRAITATGGHGRGMFAVEVAGVDPIREQVRAQVSNGARVVKVIATGGVVTPGIGVDFTAFSQEELDAAVDEARALGVPVAAHAHGAEGILRAVRAGVDSIEHGSQIDEEMAEVMKERGTFHVATISPGREMLEHVDEIPDYAAEKSRELALPRELSFRRTLAAGVRHAAGTDAGTPFNVHGSLPAELASMVAWGMAPLDALRAATVNGAELLRVTDAGRVEPGSRADLVLYEENPVDDVAALSKPAQVWLAGLPML